MGQTSKKCRVSISQSGNSIRLRWRVNGERFSSNPGLDYTEDGLATARDIKSAIESDVKEGKFDSSLAKYRIGTDGRFLIKSPHLLSQFDLWVTDYVNGDADNPYYTDPRSFLKRRGDFYLEDFLQVFNKTKIAPKTYNNRLYCLRRFFKFLLSQGKIPFNPLAEVCRRRNNLPPDEKRLPLTAEEIAVFLEAIQMDRFVPKCSRYSHSHYLGFFYFIFNTGVRNSEAIGLRVKHVN